MASKMLEAMKPVIVLISYHNCVTALLKTSYCILVLQSAMQMHASQMAPLFWKI